VFVRARPEIRLELNGDGNGWTRVTGDVCAVPGIRIQRGHRGNSIKDLTAPTGTATFCLHNDRRANSARMDGYYSIGHANCRPGFKEGIGVMIDLHGAGIETEFRGRIGAAKPSAGNRGRRDVAVTCVDWMEEAAKTRIKGIPTQTGQRADQLITTLLALPGLKQPASVSLDTGKDIFPFAFDDVRDGKTSVRAALSKILSSGGQEYGHIMRNGALRYENRNYRLINNQVPAITLDNTMYSMEAIRDAERVINRIEVTVHPRVVGADIVTLAETQETQLVPPGGAAQAITFRVNYTDPNSPGRTCGGANIQSLVAGTDYMATTGPDRTGEDRTSDVAVVFDPGGTAAEFTVQNNGAAGLYFWSRVQGNVVTTYEPITRSAQDDDSIDEHGERDETFDMPYQGSGVLAQVIANYILSQRKDPQTHLDAITIMGNRSESLMLAAMTVDVSSLVAIKERKTGIDRSYFVNGVSLDILRGGIVYATWVLASADTTAYWLFNIPGRTEFGTTNKFAPI